MPDDNFFTRLGQATARQLAKNLDHDRARADADRILTSHLRGDIAMDQNYTNTMPPRGGTNYDQDPNDPADPNGNTGRVMLDAEACLLLVTKCANGLDDDERGKFIEGLSNMATEGGLDSTLEIRHNPNGNGNGNGNGNNQGRANMPPTRDAGLRANNTNALDRVRPSNRGATDNRRPPAQDAAIRSLQTSSFHRRFPFIAGAVSHNEFGR